MNNATLPNTAPDIRHDASGGLINDAALIALRGLQTGDRPASAPSPLLTLRLLLRSQLLRHAERCETVSEGQLLQRLTPFLPELDVQTLRQGLALLMREDARDGRPYLAALACAPCGGLPWKGFKRIHQRLADDAAAPLPEAKAADWPGSVERAHRFYGGPRTLRAAPDA